MTQMNQVYKCGLCGNIVVVVHAGDGELTCCDQTMALCEEKTADSATEKHVPVVEKVEGGIKVTVGSTLHPMEDDHYIEWIELQAGDKTMRQALKPGDEPVAVFEGVAADSVVAREYCNKHGLWKG